MQNYTMLKLQPSVQGLLFFATAALAFEFTNEPRNVTVMEREIAYFPCEYRGARDLPSWRINGSRYAYTSVPYGYRSNSSGLVIPQVTRQMNGVSVSCVLSLDTEVFRSKTGYIIIVDNNIIAENLGPATESARIENQLNKVTPTAMLSSTIVASFQNPFTSSSYNHRCLSSVPTSTPGLTSTKNNRDSIIGNWTAIIIIIIGLYMYYSTGFLVVGLTILTAVSLITASLSFMVCKGCKRRAEKRQEHIYDVPSLPCRDMEIEKNVAYATVLPETQWNEAYATTRRTDIVMSTFPATRADNVYETVHI
ncbi:hypothetical protein GBAR_LOCUS23133 [Geodia barretti]|uniref:Ig-like domain-containing protein n=1 Tax=Geodia barretti TaxID=519541 RepID=A0AA35T4J3_GEOBA|nr:hypothetical protein GBAR_LOCUS23133 [Geodia barretti]